MTTATTDAAILAAIDRVRLSGAYASTTAVATEAGISRVRANNAIGRLSTAGRVRFGALGWEVVR